MMNNPVWVVKDVVPKDDYTLIITFTDNTKKVYNALPLLEKPLFKDLKNLSFFMRAKAQYGSVVWSDDIDIAPEHLYEESIEYK